MNKNKYVVSLFALIFCALIFTSAAHAQTAQRTFVSTSGNDANTASLCSRNMPCRSFAAAISVVAPGGEVVALDSGGYGAFTINKAVQIIGAPGVYAGISVFPSSFFYDPGVQVNVAATAVVVLRNISINSQGGVHGIRLSSGKLRVENCVISNFVGNQNSLAGTGITVDSSDTELTVKDTVLRDNQIGIQFTAGAIRATIAHCRIESTKPANGYGILVYGNNQVTVANSTITGNDVGLFTRRASAPPIALLTVTNCIVSNNRIGLYADKDSQIHLDRSTVTLNDTGTFTLLNGIIYSVGNNAILGNTTTNIGGNVVKFQSDVN